MSSPNNRQVGGDHYSSSYQHWDFVEDVGLGYLEAQATRYVARWRKKNGLEDLQKADHYLEKLLQRDRCNRVEWIRLDVKLALFIEENIPIRADAVCITLIATWQTPSEIRTARDIIRQLMRSAEQRYRPDGTPLTDSNRHAR